MDRRAAVVEAYAAGATLTAIERTLGVPVSTAHAWLCQADQPRRRRGRPRTPPERDQAIRAAWRAGERICDLAARYGLTPARIGQIIERVRR
jgi:transposase-like protein